MAHELGHTLGMHHDRGSAGLPSSPACNFGYYISVKRGGSQIGIYRSVMAYPAPCNYCQRIGILSQPKTLTFPLPFGNPLTIGPMGIACKTPPSGGNYDRATNMAQFWQAVPVAAGFR